MPSPFPGMNPYVEKSDVWEDFHDRFIVFMAGALETQVGPNYLVKIENRLYVHELSAEERRFLGRGDVGVNERIPGREAGSGRTVMDAPYHLFFPAVDLEREAYVEIRDRRDRRVVTVLELLSPTNKSKGPDRDQYVHKRRQILASPTHLVEIDWLRGGERPDNPGSPPSAYYALVSRAPERPRVGYWPIGLRDPLPVLPVPLTAPDPDVPLDLKALLNRVYDEANYGKYIYEQDPQPELSPEDAAWARQFVPGGK